MAKTGRRTRNESRLSVENKRRAHRHARTEGCRGGTVGRGPADDHPRAKRVLRRVAAAAARSKAAESGPRMSWPPPHRASATKTGHIRALYIRCSVLRIYYCMSVRGTSTRQRLEWEWMSTKKNRKDGGEDDLWRKPRRRKTRVVASRGKPNSPSPSPPPQRSTCWMSVNTVFVGIFSLSRSPHPPP